MACATGYYPKLGFRDVTPKMENQMEKKMENEMEATAYRDYVVVEVPKIRVPFCYP